MTERERQIRERARTMGLWVEKSYGARFAMTRGNQHLGLALGMREAEVWLEGYEAGLARVFAARVTS